MQAVRNDFANQDGGRSIGENPQEHAAGEMPQRVVHVQLEAAAEENQDQRERAKCMRDVAKLLATHPMQHGTDQQAGAHQHHDVGHVGPMEEAVGEEGQDQQAAEQTE